MKTMRKIIQIDEELCNGCGACVPSCAEGAIQVIDGKARLVSEKYCDGLGACLGECPTGALKVIEREADDFDEQAVQVHLSKAPSGPVVPTPAPAAVPPVHGGCPGARLQSFQKAPVSAPSVGGEIQPSSLTHWPVQIRLIPPHADFLAGADLLVAADCVPVAYPDFHRDFLQGRKVMIGCPKFDDLDLYIQRFTDLFAQNDLNSVTVVVMQVPCCQGLPMAVAQGRAAAGKSIPIEKVVVGLEGEILRREKI